MVAGLGVSALPDALAEAESLKALLWVRLFGAAAPHPQEEDRLLEVEEAARRLGVSTETLYRKAKTLPFRVKVGASLRFSSAGIDTWIRTRRGR